MAKNSLGFVLKDLGMCCVIVILAAIIGVTVNLFRDKPLPLIYESKAVRMENAVARIASETTLSAPVGQVTLPETITVENLQKFLKDNRGLVFDARPEIFYRLGHIPSALSLPREDFENAYKIYQKDLEKDRHQPIIIYCSSSSCEDAGLVQKSLKSLGYTNVATFAGGWAEWEKKQLPVETNK